MSRVFSDAEYLEQLRPFEDAMHASIARGERFNPEGFWHAALDPEHASLNRPEFLTMLAVASLMQVPNDAPTREQIDARAQTLTILLTVANRIGWGKVYQLLAQSENT